MPRVVPRSKIPASWTDEDRRAYIRIGKRRKEEHVASYAVIAIGSQLFFDISHLKLPETGDDGSSADAEATRDENGGAPSL